VGRSKHRQWVRRALVEHVRRVEYSNRDERTRRQYDRWWQHRDWKENFHAVDGESVLKKVGGLNLTSWNYIGHNPQQFRHYGPVAEEFFAAFGQDAVGTIGTPTTINSGDLEGILMVAVQALERRTAENADLRARIEALEKLVKGMTTEER
jgi:hypothetical protein